MPTPKRFFRMVEAKPKKNGSPETKETITLPSWINRLYSARTAFIGEWFHNFVMPLPSGEDVVVFDIFDNDFYMLRLWIVVHPDHIDVRFAVSFYNFLSSHTSLPGFNCFASL